MNPEDNVNRTKANHSGNPKLPDDVREQPTREFDNTPLEQAHTEGLIDPLTGEIGIVRPKPDQPTIPTHEGLDEIMNWDKDRYGKALEKGPNKKKALILKVVGGIAVFAAGIGVTAAIMGGQKDASAIKTPKAPVTNSAPATPNATQSAPEQGNNPEVTGEVLKPTLSIEAMDAMTVEGFATIPFADRANYMIEKCISTGWKPGTEADYKVNLVGDTTGNTIFHYWNNVIGCAWSHSGTPEGAKIESGMLYYTTDASTGAIDNRYSGFANDIISAGPDGGAGTGYTYIDSGKPQKGVDVNSNPINFTNLTFNQTLNQYDGTSKNIGIFTAQVVRSVVEASDGNRYVIPAMGHVVDGHNAPDPNYPY